MGIQLDELRKVLKKEIKEGLINTYPSLFAFKQVNNQNFVSIPHSKFISLLAYKCGMVGINVVTTEESYTSKCDALAMEEIRHHDTYLGKRKKRGIFQSSVGKLINAHVNGALNIMRKVVGDSPVRRIVDRGRLFRPVLLRDIYHLGICPNA